MRLDVCNLSVAIHGKPIVSDVSLSVGEGEFVGLLGPNGCGKSTTLRAIYRLNRRYDGQILWDGCDERTIAQKEFARRVAVVGQFNDIAFDFTVREIVLMGRAPHMGVLSRETGRDNQIVAEALEKVDMAAYAQRSFASLSGGERQRVILARALAQEPQFLVLDEPTNHLDIKHQLQVLAIARDLGIGCLAALHDLAMASRFVDRVCLMKAGRVVAAGPIGEVVSAQSIREVYDVEARVEPAACDDDGWGGGLTVTYRRPVAPREACAAREGGPEGAVCAADSEGETRSR